MKEALVDISVLIVFFTRSDTLQQVFNRVKEVRPARLFLYQDGPRKSRPDDSENISRCREVVSAIDWECEVHTLYQEKNYGPDASGYLASTWAFSQTDKCIVLEDDVIPSLSYFAFCKEMLDRYEHNEKVMLISGWNLEEQTKGITADYFFSCTTFTMAWASWARVVRQWDPSMKFLDDREQLQKMKDFMARSGIPTHRLERYRKEVANGKLSWESVLIAHQYKGQGLTIVPTANMACNIGVGGDSAHYCVPLNLMARGESRIFAMKTYEVDIPHLRHPDAVEDYPLYRKNTYRIRAWGYPWVRVWRLLETTVYQLCFGRNRKEVLASVFRKICRLIRRIVIEHEHIE